MTETPNAGPGPLIVLVGPPGSGKSTIGAEMAQRFELEFMDSDTQIEAQEGRSISDIFVDDGEETFRVLERAAVLRAVRDHRGVLSLGGGAVMTPDVADALVAVPSSVHVVFLDVGIADAASRVGFDASRPLLVVNPRASWNRLMRARRPTYERVATIRIDTAGRSVADIADEIEHAVRERTS